MEESLLEKISYWILKAAQDRGAAGLVLDSWTINEATIFCYLACSKITPKLKLPLHIISNDLASLNIIKNTFNISDGFNIVVDDFYQKVKQVCYYSNEKNLIVVNPIMKYDWEIIRNFPKNSFIADILPCANLTKTQIVSEFNNSLPIAFDNNIALSEFNGFQLTQQELEWVGLLQDRTMILSSDPTKSKSWFAFSTRQKQILAKLHQVYLINQYKFNPNIPVYHGI